MAHTPSSKPRAPDPSPHFPRAQPLICRPWPQEDEGAAGQGCLLPFSFRKECCDRDSRRRKGTQTPSGTAASGPSVHAALLALHSPLSSRASTSTRSSSRCGWAADLHGNPGAHLQRHGMAALCLMLPGTGTGPALGDPWGPGEDVHSSGLQDSRTRHTEQKGEPKASPELQSQVKLKQKPQTAVPTGRISTTGAGRQLGGLLVVHAK